MNKLLLGISVSTIALTTPALAQELAPPAPPSETSTSVATTGSGTASTATGVNEGGGNLGDIIVTAQRRAQNVQDVPIAVSAFDTTELARRQITRTLDIVQYVPNMEGHNNTTVGTANTYSLRALNNTESIPTFDPPVGTYVDDIYISRQGANNISFFDVERVEVLRGPQGTLFGRNTTGGAINVIIRKPGDELKGYAEVGYGKYDRKQARASIDIPLSDKIFTKFSGYYAKDDGYVRNVTTGQKFNFEDSYGLRGAVRFLLTDTIKWDVSGEYDDNNLSNVINFTRPGSKKRIGFTRQLQGVTLGDRGLTTTPQLADQSIGNRAYTTAITSNLEFEVDDRTTANFIFGYRNLHQEIFSDSFDSLSSAGVTFAVDGSLVNTGTGAVLGSASGFGIVNTPIGTSTPGVADQTSKQYSQEVKLTGKLGDQFEYVAGFYYFNERNNTFLTNINLPAVGNPTLTQERQIRNTTVAYAGYAQVDFKPTDTLTFTVGARYTDEVKRFGIQTLPSPLPRNNPNFNSASLASLPTPIPLRQHTSQLTPRFAINYEVVPDIRLFASATRGFKSGGWNARGNTANQVTDFGPETIWSYEGGLKSDLLDRRLRVNLTGFYFKVKNYQLPAGYPDPNTNTIIFITDNFSDFQNYGLEAEISANPIDGLNLFGSAGLQHARYTNFDPAVTAQAARCRAGVVSNCNTGIVTTTGSLAKPTRAPGFSSVLGANYEIGFGGDVQLIPTVNWSFTKSHWIGAANTPIISRQANRNLFNAGLTLQNKEQGWSLTAECTNCTNLKYEASYLIYPYLGEPVRWMVRAHYDF